MMKKTNIHFHVCSSSPILTYINFYFPFILQIAYASISKKMGTFRTRKQKLIPPGIDSFGKNTVLNKNTVMYKCVVYFEGYEMPG
jgi:hypothetical protein